MSGASRADDPAADHEQVEALRAEPLQDTASCVHYRPKIGTWRRRAVHEPDALAAELETQIERQLHEPLGSAKSISLQIEGFRTADPVLVPHGLRISRTTL
jgi:hypothetical protein